MSLTILNPNAKQIASNVLSDGGQLSIIIVVIGVLVYIVGGWIIRRVDKKYFKNASKTKT